MSGKMSRIAAICVGLLLLSQSGSAAGLRGVMSPGNMCTEDDFQTLQKWNVNLMRRQFMRNWNKINTDLDIAEFSAWIDQKCNDLDQELVWAEKYGIAIILDMHASPGGRIKGHIPRMYREAKYADAFIAVWEKIAKRYKGDKRIIAFDIFNEPVTSPNDPINFWDLQIRAAKAIRAIDPDRVIVFEVDEWDSALRFQGRTPVDMPNIIYQAHMYQPNKFTHQFVGSVKGKCSYPGVIAGEMWDKERLKLALQPVRDFQLKYNVPIYIGEFSAINWADGAGQYIADCIDIFEEYGWNWSFHAFRESQGWSVEYVGDHKTRTFTPSQDNPRKRALLNGFKRNKK